MRRLRKDNTLTFSRYSGDQVLNTTTYEYENAAPTTFTASGTLEPLTANELATLPEGKRSNKAYYFFTTTELSEGTDHGDRQPADTTTIKNVKYQVVDNGDYGNTSRKRMKHYEAILIMVTEEEG